MQTSLKDSSKRLVWLRLGLVAMALLGVITLLLVTNSRPVEAAPEVTLHSGDLLIASPKGCSLVLVNATKTRARLNCDAFTPTATATATATATEEEGFLDSADDQEDMFKFTSDVVSAPETKIRRTIKPGRRLIVLATADECKLKVVEETASLIRIKCKPLPVVVTPTYTPTRTRTRTPTPKPGGPNGRWAGITDQGRPVGFFVTDNLGKWQSFQVQVIVNQCLITLGITGPVPIQNNQFAAGGNLPSPYSGSLFYNGTFNSNSNLTGTWSANNMGHPQCGSMTKNGNWDANWKSASIDAPAPDESAGSTSPWQVTITSR